MKSERIKVVKLLQDERIKEFIYPKVKEYRNNAYKYFKQEGLISDDQWAIVDIGWNGTLQRSISRILELNKYNSSVKGLYFGLRSRKKNKDSDQMFAYFLDYNKPAQIEDTISIIPIIELFVAADHGGVKRYSIIDNSIQPVLKHR